MWIVFLINSIVGCLFFVVSATIAGIFHCATLNLLGNINELFFIPVLIISLSIFYLVFLCLAIIYCRIVTALLKKNVGTFPNNSTVQLLRVTADVLTSHLATPLYPSMPFLIPFMGAKVGNNLIFTGKIFNADLFEAGNNVLIGEDAFLSGHIQHENRMILGKIKIGNDVSVGVRSFIMPDVEIGDRSIIAAYAVVKQGTGIPPGEIWGGIPARKIGESNIQAVKGAT